MRVSCCPGAQLRYKQAMVKSPTRRKPRAKKPPSRASTRVGIAGLGAIGRAVARRCRGYEMRILAHDIAPDPAYARAHGIELVPLETLLRESDFVTLHAPHTPETDRLIDAARLRLMKPSAFLINTARGGLVDEAALHEALRTRQIAGAGLDVYEFEPKLTPGLAELENVVLLPHLGSATDTTRRRMSQMAAQNIILVLSGRPPLNPLN